MARTGGAASTTTGNATAALLRPAAPCGLVTHAAPRAPGSAPRLPAHWRPARWLWRMRASDLKAAEAEDSRCVRCGRWPDQNTGVRGDWLIQPLTLCPGCHQRVEWRLQSRGDSLHELAARWPRRGRRPGAPPSVPEAVACDDVPDVVVRTVPLSGGIDRVFVLRLAHRPGVLAPPDEAMAADTTPYGRAKADE
jgi:hypothetical protein